MNKLKDYASRIGFFATLAAILQLLWSNHLNAILVGLLFLSQWAWVLLIAAVHLGRKYKGRNIISDSIDQMEIGEDLSRNADEIAKDVFFSGQSKISIVTQFVAEYAILSLGCFYMIWMAPEFSLTGIVLASCSIIVALYDFLDGTGPGQSIAKRLGIKTDKDDKPNSFRFQPKIRTAPL